MELVYIYHWANFAFYLCSTRSLAVHVGSTILWMISAVAIHMQSNKRGAENEKNKKITK